MRQQGTCKHQCADNHCAHINARLSTCILRAARKLRPCDSPPYCRHAAHFPTPLTAPSSFHHHTLTTLGKGGVQGLPGIALLLLPTPASPHRLPRSHGYWGRTTRQASMRLPGQGCRVPIHLQPALWPAPTCLCLHGLADAVRVHACVRGREGFEKERALFVTEKLERMTFSCDTRSFS